MIRLFTGTDEDDQPSDIALQPISALAGQKPVLRSLRREDLKWSFEAVKNCIVLRNGLMAMVRKKDNDPIPSRQFRLRSFILGNDLRGRCLLDTF